MEFGNLLALVVVTVGTVLHVSPLSALSDLTYFSIVEDTRSSRDAAVAVDVFWLERVTVLFCPQLCHSLPFGIVVHLRRLEGRAIRTRDSTMGYNLLHHDPSDGNSFCTTPLISVARAKSGPPEQVNLRLQQEAADLD